MGEEREEGVCVAGEGGSSALEEGPGCPAWGREVQEGWQREGCEGKDPLQVTYIARAMARGVSVPRLHHDCAAERFVRRGEASSGEVRARISSRLREYLENNAIVFCYIDDNTYCYSKFINNPPV